MRAACCSKATGLGFCAADRATRDTGGARLAGGGHVAEIPNRSEICNGTVCTVDEIGNGSVGEIANGSVGEIANGSVAEIANGSVAEIPRRLRARERPEKRPGPVP